MIGECKTITTVTFTLYYPRLSGPGKMSIMKAEGSGKMRSGYVREYRQHTPEEKERILRGACPHCGRERVHFNPGNEHTICCQTSCSMEYWFSVRTTIAEMRRRVRDEQGGKCARCRKEVHEYTTTEGADKHPPYILDHIIPIAMGGDQWARDNLQVLCKRCNRIKTAWDMGRIARWKKYYLRGWDHQEGASRQVLLFLESSIK
jgi:5-methylcytosine-specific restriction endonuclease McrA